MSQLLVRALGIAGASWLLLAGNSPLSSHLTGMPLITNVASAVNLPSTLFALSGFPGSAAPSNAAVALVATAQWLAYGLAAAWLWRKLWPNNSSKPTPLRGAA
ncbi:hypothetical protein [Cognatilysobacter bugurensis]|uniref:Uncharacterized protein n=1 Tax=Cognatilysobacter bugurensis TaxID=543356 RepID=A0A918W8L8_9GAMM|nr:hypothetical protein [Lysobacter bugurensis]GHA76797.1 hypothetical protein GCM10007067_12590 [Lysobacter bugurensis]